jgi:hypothetical protein
MEEFELGAVRQHRHWQPDAPDVIAAQRLADGRLDLVAPERPKGIPLAGNVGKAESRPLQEAGPYVDVVG